MYVTSKHRAIKPRGFRKAGTPGPLYNITHASPSLHLRGGVYPIPDNPQVAHGLLFNRRGIT